MGIDNDSYIWDKHRVVFIVHIGLTVMKGQLKIGKTVHFFKNHNQFFQRADLDL